jgi:GNAT superfamily N-acetyltransferase
LQNLTQGAVRKKSPDNPSVIPRIKGQAWIFERNLSMLCDNRRVLVGEDQESKKIVCFAMLIDNSQDSYSLFDKIRVGLLSAPFSLGWEPFIRLLTTADLFEDVENRAWKIKCKDDSSPTSPNYLRLERVAVEPDAQGYGIGSALIATVGELLDSEGAAGFLTTQNELTADLYKKAGWAPIGEPEQLGTGTSLPYLNWNMWRPPQKIPKILTR